LFISFYQAQVLSPGAESDTPPRPHSQVTPHRQTPPQDRSRSPSRSPPNTANENHEAQSPLPDEMRARKIVITPPPNINVHDIENSSELPSMTIVPVAVHLGHPPHEDVKPMMRHRLEEKIPKRRSLDPDGISLGINV